MTIVTKGVGPELAVKMVWSNLRCGLAGDDFLDQPVSVPTPECLGGSVVRDDVWHFPEEITAERTAHNRRISWEVRLGKGRLTDPEHAGLLMFGKRYAVARMSRPRAEMLHLGTVKDDVYCMCRFLRHVVDVSGSSRQSDIASLTVDDASKLMDAISVDWKPGGSAFLSYLNFIIELQDLGLRGIVGSTFEPATFEYIVGRLSDGLGSVRINRGTSRFVARHTVPVTDEYCLAIMDISEWFCRVLAPCIIDHVSAYTRFRDEERALASDRRVKLHELACVRYEAFAASQKWPVADLPFDYNGHFPPRCFRELLPLIWSLQMLVWQHVAIFTGPHEHELLLLEPEGLKRDAKELHTLRFKTSANLGGEPFAWPIPASVADALDVQIRLCRAAGFEGIWFGTLGWKRLTSGVCEQLRKFVARHGLAHLLGDDPKMTTRRFRPQLARLLILGPNGYYRLVKRALGHSDIRTSMAYVHMNRHIDRELTQRDERRKAEDGGTSCMPVCEGELTAEALASLLSDLGRRGRTLSIVAPGVYCDQGMAEAFHLPRFDDEQVRLASFSFAMDKLASADVRALPSLFEWFADQARIIGEACDARTAYRPPTPRHGRLSAIVLKTDVAHAP